MPAATEEIVVKWQKDIFRSPANGYTVAVYTKKKEETSIVCSGTELPNNKKVYYRFTGSFTNTKYGEQFAVQGHTIELGETKKDYAELLGSGIIKGIGKVLAKRLCDAFGKDVFNVLDTEPEKLLSVKGITSKNLAKIVESYRTVRGIDRIYGLLKDCPEITYKMCEKILKKYRGEAEEIVKTQTYRLMEIPDITFPIVDDAAGKMGLPRNSKERLEAGMLYILMENEKEGHLSMAPEALGVRLLELFAKDGSYSKQSMTQMFQELVRKHPGQKVFAQNRRYPDGRVEGHVYRMGTYLAEVSVAENIHRLLGNPKDNIKDIDEKVMSAMERLGFSRDASQIEAVKRSLTEPVSIIKGGPGTGKTTVLKVVADVYTKNYRGTSVIFMAPTGRAARRITESTGYPASTIHSRLQVYDLTTGSVDLSGDDEEVELTEDLIIVDESSMMDIFITAYLLKAIRGHSKVIFVGDPDQLQSVGPGAVFRDMIECGVIPTSCLTSVHRQGDGCIKENAERIRRGCPDLVTGKDFHIVEGLQGEELENAMLLTYLCYVQKYGPESVACICPVKDWEAGVISMNRKIQEIYNPLERTYQEYKSGYYCFRPGDLVMELKNTEKTVNGDIGIVETVASGDPERAVTVRFFGDTLITYPAEELDRLTLAYAMTVHKAQGSEYDYVITCLQDKNVRMARRNIIYTAVTRGKKEVYFMGSVQAMKRAVQRAETAIDRRRTQLAYRIRVLEGEVEYI